MRNNIRQELINKYHLYFSPLAFGMCAMVNPYSEKATKLLDVIEPEIKYCDMEDCNEDAVRVGIFGDYSNEYSEFRGLCERHKQMGIWSNFGKAMGEE